MTKPTNTEITIAPEVIDTYNQTPIEVALQIDEDGMPTASNLYEFLELNPSNFSRWCAKNIKNNKFAIEKEDYIPSVIQEERYNPNPKTDYKLTADFAKKLSMTGNTEKHEQARQYFIACEQGLKTAAMKMYEYTDKLKTTIDEMQQDIQDLKDQVAVKRNKYSPLFTKMKPKYELLEKHFGCTRKELYKSIYIELEDTYDVSINEIYDDYCYENMLSKNECYPMEAIEHHEELRKGLIILIDDALKKYNLVDKHLGFKRASLFDTPVG